MKRLLGIWILMVCALAAHAQLMGPGYIMGNQQEKINGKDRRVYEYIKLYKAAENNDCKTVKKMLDNGFDINEEATYWQKDHFELKHIPDSWEEASDPDYTDGHLVPGKFLTVTYYNIPQQFGGFGIAARAVQNDNVCILKELQRHGFKWKGCGGLFTTAYVGRHLAPLKFLLTFQGEDKEKIGRSKEPDELEKKALAFVSEEEAKAAKAQQNAVQREVKQSLQKKK